MEIGFATRKMKKEMESESALRRAYGKRADALMLRLGLLDSASCLADVPHTPPELRHELTGNRAGTFAVGVSRNFRLILRPDHDPVPLKDDGGIDLDAVTAIIVLGVEDYHGK